MNGEKCKKKKKKKSQKVIVNSSFCLLLQNAIKAEKGKIKIIFSLMKSSDKEKKILLLLHTSRNKA